MTKTFVSRKVIRFHSTAGNSLLVVIHIWLMALKLCLDLGGGGDSVVQFYQMVYQSVVLWPEDPPPERSH